MIIKVNKFPKWFRFGALAFWRWVFIRPECVNDKALIAHECAHLEDQRNWLSLPGWLSLLSAILWVVMYWVSFRFRFTAEVIGFAAQVKANGCSVQWAAASITNRYWTFCTFEQAEAALIRLTT